MKTALCPAPTSDRRSSRRTAPGISPAKKAAIKHWCLARAEEWYARKEAGAARDFLQYAAAVDPDDAEVWLALGAIQFGLGAHAQAGRAFVRAGRLKPDDPRVFLFLAVTHERLGDLAHAEALYRHSLSLQPDNPLALARFSSFLFEQHRYAEARDFLERALTEETSDLGLVARLGECCRQMGDLPAARACFEHVLKLDPTNEIARARLTLLANRDC